MTLRCERSFYIHFKICIRIFTSFILSRTETIHTLLSKLAIHLLFRSTFSVINDNLLNWIITLYNMMYAIFLSLNFPISIIIIHINKLFPFLIFGLNTWKWRRNWIGIPLGLWNLMDQDSLIDGWHLSCHHSHFLIS